MGIKDFIAGRNESEPERPASEPIRTKPPISASPASPTPSAPLTPTITTKPTATPATFIDATCSFEGSLRCKKTLRIDGHVSGEVHCESTLRVSDSATVHANIEAETVQISGEVKGNITAHRKITLDREARVVGDLATRGIVIEEGAQLTGRIVIGVDTPASEASRTTTEAVDSSRSNEPDEALVPLS